MSTQGGPLSIYLSIRDRKDHQHKLLYSASVTTDQAYQLINQLSQDTNRKVYAVAQDIVDRATIRAGDPDAQAHPML